MRRRKHQHLNDTAGCLLRLLMLPFILVAKAVTYLVLLGYYMFGSKRSETSQPEYQSAGTSQPCQDYKLPKPVLQWVELNPGIMIAVVACEYLPEETIKYYIVTDDGITGEHKSKVKYVTPKKRKGQITTQSYRCIRLNNRDIILNIITKPLSY